LRRCADHAVTISTAGFDDKNIPETFGKNSLMAVINVLARALYVDQLMQCSTVIFPVTVSFLLPAFIHGSVKNVRILALHGSERQERKTFGLKGRLFVLGSRLLLRNAFGLGHCSAAPGRANGESGTHRLGLRDHEARVTTIDVQSSDSSAVAVPAKGLTAGPGQSQRICAPGPAAGPGRPSHWP
jgi:hypothetical protein